MVLIEEVEEMLNKIALSLPQEFYNKLNGGILLLPEEKRHPEGKNNDLYILGEYCCSSNLGRYIIIYYGSFIRSYSYLTKELLYKKLEETVIHEFTHHIESLAGEDSLIRKDKERLQKYKRRK